MKTKRFLMLGLIAGALCLGGCGNKENNANQNSNANPSENGGGQNPPAPLTLLETLKAKAKSMASRILNKSESAITFAEYEGETADADVYYYDSTNLTFVDVEIYKESFDTNFADNLKAYLPSNAALTYSDDVLDYLDDYGMAWYDRYYSDGEYTYNIYVEAYDEDDIYPAETYGCIFIFKTSQETAFDNYMSSEE